MAALSGVREDTTLSDVQEDKALSSVQDDTPLSRVQDDEAPLDVDEDDEEKIPDWIRCSPADLYFKRDSVVITGFCVM